MVEEKRKVRSVEEWRLEFEDINRKGRAMLKYFTEKRAAELRDHEKICGVVD